MTKLEPMLTMISRSLGETARSGVTAPSVVMRALVRQGMEKRDLEISLFLGAIGGLNEIRDLQQSRV